ncbi:PadR family transcriptional regulator [Streptomyces specialis]|uniref:PadR family transcriptional regulator n=1 Tax=Streptomyces specialis TaxID=498367 RepID=UPI00073F01D9|nr:PadR family transcriptional regulator [Streptomyces specialis]
MRLTPTSYIVLGLARWSPGVTAYELERTINATVSHMWTIQRSQIYREPARLAEAGLLTAETEGDGRTRTRFTITPDGERSLDAWLAEGVQDMPQLRDLAILKVFFGAGPQALARTRLLAHQARLKEYELLREVGGLAQSGPRLALEAAIAHERTSIRYWSDLAKSSS